MLVLRKFWRSNFLIKLRSWEYWPFGVVYAPVFVYWAWLSFKARSFFFFSASNPSIENGGMLGESKAKIFELIPNELKPITLFFSKNSPLNKVREKIVTASLTYPLIAKPDIGERGWLVEKINNDGELRTYVKETPVNFLIQEFLNEPIEMGVFYYRYPNKAQGEVTSIVIKEMLSITGDGENTLGQLAYDSDRAKLQLPQLHEKYRQEWQSILDRGETRELVSIGNHCLGTKFLNGNHLINESLSETFDKISKSIEGFYYGRYDIRVQSIENLYLGKIKIMELNGSGAEPAHIYDPEFSFFRGVGVLLRHWSILYKVSVQNHKKGIPYLSWKEGRREYAKVLALNKLK
ncbi:MAG: hypothetical protein AAF149_18305 [Bacteroidota bacterium]